MNDFNDELQTIDSDDPQQSQPAQPTEGAAP